MTWIGLFALELTLIAAVYIGFAVADGRPRVTAVECIVAAVFVVLAATQDVFGGTMAHATPMTTFPLAWPCSR